MTNSSAPHANFWKNSVFWHFWKNLTKTLSFSARAPRSKSAYFGAQGAFRKFLGSVSRKWISQNSSKGDSLGQQGVESLKKSVRLSPPPLNPLVHITAVVFGKSTKKFDCFHWQKQNFAIYEWGTKHHEFVKH